MSDTRWSIERINAWYQELPWLVGCTFIPSTAINQLEMWQADTFDLKTIQRELDWAADAGLNAVRVFLHDLAWQQDPEGFKKRIDKFLDAAKKNHILTTLVFFDDCWNSNPQAGQTTRTQTLHPQLRLAAVPGYQGRQGSKAMGAIGRICHRHPDDFWQG